VAYVKDNNPDKFPKPHTWATFIPNRSQRFKTHSTLGKAKSAVTSCRTYQGMSEAWVYEFNPDADSWEERFHVQEGASPENNPLTGARNTTRKVKTIKPLDESELQEVYASIAKAVAPEEAP
jgi:hypothetical protein